MEITCVAPVGDRTGEGAVWSASEQALYWVDITRFLTHRWDAATRAVHSWHFTEPTCALALTDRPGTLLLAMASRIILWRPESDARMEFGWSLPGSPRVRLNDGRPDPSGRFWVGSMKNNILPDGDDGTAGKGEGSLFRIAPDGSATVMVERIGISNTMCWSPDRTRFYTADSMENRVDVYQYDDAAGTIVNPRPFLSGHPRGVPDGSNMDAEGRLWNCRFGGGCVLRVTAGGVVDLVLEMPVPNITTCTFGGPDLRTLFITSANRPAAAGDRLAGSLFSVPVDVPGMAENVVRLDA